MPTSKLVPAPAHLKKPARPSPLSPEQEQYCWLRASGTSIGEAAKRCGIHPNSASAWNADPRILSRIDELQAPIRSQVMHTFRSRAINAAERIIALMEADTAREAGRGAAVNLNAAVTVLKHAGFEPVAQTDVRVLAGVKVFLDPVMDEV